MARRGLLVAFLFAGAGGCSALVDLSGYSGDDPESDDAATIDASSDGGCTDCDSGNPGRDGAIDASKISSEAGCGAIDAYFCADFDDAVLSAGWTSTFTSGDGSVSADDDGAVSLPFALRASVAPPDGGTASAGFALQRPVPAGNAHIEFDIVVNQLGEAVGVPMAMTYSGIPGETSHSVSLALRPTATQIAERITRTDGAISQIDTTLGNLDGNLTAGASKHVTIDFAASPPTMTVKYGTLIVLDHAYLQSAATGTSMSFNVGITYSSGEPIEVHLDNVVLDFVENGQ